MNPQRPKSASASMRSRPYTHKQRALEIYFEPNRLIANDNGERTVEIEANREFIPIGTKVRFAARPSEPKVAEKYVSSSFGKNYHDSKSSSNINTATIVEAENNELVDYVDYVDNADNADNAENHNGISNNNSSVLSNENMRVASDTIAHYMKSSKPQRPRSAAALLRTVKTNQDNPPEDIKLAIEIPASDDLELNNLTGGDEEDLDLSHLSACGKGVPLSPRKENQRVSKTSERPRSANHTTRANMKGQGVDGDNSKPVISSTFKVNIVTQKSDESNSKSSKHKQFRSTSARSRPGSASKQSLNLYRLDPDYSAEIDTEIGDCSNRIDTEGSNAVQDNVDTKERLESKDVTESQSPQAFPALMIRVQHEKREQRQEKSEKQEKVEKDVTAGSVITKVNDQFVYTQEDLTITYSKLNEPQTSRPKSGKRRVAPKRTESTGQGWLHGINTSKDIADCNSKDVKDEPTSHVDDRLLKLMKQQLTRFNEAKRKLEEGNHHSHGSGPTQSYPGSSSSNSNHNQYNSITNNSTNQSYHTSNNQNKQNPNNNKSHFHGQDGRDKAIEVIENDIDREVSNMIEQDKRRELEMDLDMDNDVDKDLERDVGYNDSSENNTSVAKPLLWIKSMKHSMCSVTSRQTKLITGHNSRLGKDNRAASSFTRDSKPWRQGRGKDKPTELHTSKQTAQNDQRVDMMHKSPDNPEIVDEEDLDRLNVELDIDLIPVSLQCLVLHEFTCSSTEGGSLKKP